MPTRASLTFFLIAVTVALAGCGQKGPLYLPPPADADSSRLEQ